ncbi:MAG TPA: hypothetical protein VMT64_01820 [Candidatus Binataceae bacterium]|nr:hypothetical protein [Candidatus Binataceae bacterium]
MTAAGLREFYRRAGYRVATTLNADWYVPGGRVYRSFPCGKLVAPTREEIDELSRQRGILGVEFHNAHRLGVASGIWTIRDRDYSPHSVTRQYRQQIHRAAAHEVVREIDFDELHRLGMRANHETLARQHHHDAHFSDPRKWRRLCEAGTGTPGAGVFASFDERELTGYLIYFIVDGTSHGLATKSLDAARHTGSNHLLYFEYAHTMIRREGIDAVEIGAQWVPPMAGVDRIKRHAGFQLEPYHVAVFLRPAARTMLLSACASLALRAGEHLLGATDGLGRAHALRRVALATDETAIRIGLG